MRTGLGTRRVDPLTARADAGRRLASRSSMTTRARPEATAPGWPNPRSLYATNPALGNCNPIAPEVSIEVRRRRRRTGNGPLRPGPRRTARPRPRRRHRLASWTRCSASPSQAAGHPGMTAELTVRFRRPTPIEQVLAFEARHVAHDGRRIEAWGAIYDGEGRIAAEATAIFVLPAG